MRFKSLKTNIYANLAILLLLAVGLSDFVIIRIIENQVVENRLDELEQWLVSVTDLDQLESIDDTGLVYLTVRKEKTWQSPFPQPLDTLENSVAEAIQEATRTGRAAHRSFGRTWGIFWMRSKYMAMAVPSASLSGTAAAVVDLQPVYNELRFSQKIIFFYLAINFVVLLHVFAYRLTRLLTRPIQRLIKISNTYDSPDHFSLFSANQGDEFGRLSSAINRMMHRIERDKWMLQQSLQSIETANRDLKRAQQEIVRAEKLASTGRLSAGIAHEIGNPIGIVLGYLGLLKNPSLPSETAADYIHRAETEINRINSIIRQLLDFSRAAPESSRAFSFHDLLREAGEMLSRQPLMKNIRIEYALYAPSDLIFADYNQLHQVIVNLLINAADSIGANSGTIELITRCTTEKSETRKRFELWVQDNGCGIPEDSIEKIFDPFFTTKEPGKGTGLGLSVSYMIIERFGGTIEARNRDGAGTTMIVRLPLADAENIPPSAGRTQEKSTVHG